VPVAARRDRLSQPRMARESLLQRFLYSRYAPLITHFCTLAMIAAVFTLIVWAPLWLAWIPCAALHHRIGVMMHEYVHGIPFRRYRYSLWVLSALDGLMISFGLVEVFRGIHFAHHRWLNTEKDPGFLSATRNGPRELLMGPLWFLFSSLRGEHVYVRRNRIFVGVGLSLASIAFWAAIGLPQVALYLIALNAYSALVSSSFRGAVEHSSYPGDPHIANDYRVWLPLFNINRHIHHHYEPTRPWYLLEYKHERPLHPIAYWTHWFHVYWKRDFGGMRPLKGSRTFALEREGIIP
jgi:fatty acid desaturase